MKKVTRAARDAFLTVKSRTYMLEFESIEFELKVDEVKGVVSMCVLVSHDDHCESFFEAVGIDATYAELNRKAVKLASRVEVYAEEKGVYRV